MALPLLVLAIALVNAGNLVLARATRAVATWRVQLALGASRRRLVRQPIIEGLLLAVPAAACGLLLTRWGFRALEGTVPIDPIVDWRVVIFAFVVAMATPLVFGLVPAWSVVSRARHTTPGHVIHPARSRARTVLVVVQTALSLALLGTGTQFVRTVRAGLNDGLGDGDRMIVATVDSRRLTVPPAETDEFFERVLQRVKTVPGANRAAFLAGLNPVGGRGPEANTSWWLPGDSAGNPRGATIAYVTDGLLPAINATVISGRTLTADDHRAPVRAVLVNDQFARQLGGHEPVGMTVRLGPTDATGARVPYERGVEVTIAGVVRVAAGGRIAGGGRDDARAPTIYAPAPLVHLPARVLYVPFDDAGGLEAVLAQLQAALTDDRSRTAVPIARLDDVRWQRSEPRRFMAVAVTAAGALALLLSAAGLYGAIAYLVELRTREIGIRMALGATASSVLRLVIQEAMRIAAMGCGIGLAGAAAVAVVVRSQMYGTSTIDPVAFGGMIGVLLTVMLVAGAVPASRAARVDPVVALRSE
jgi:putative ABC transport system permease protein